MEDIRQAIIDFEIPTSFRPANPVEWYEQWTANLPSLPCPVKPVKQKDHWQVPVITNIKIQYQLDFESRLFGPELLLATGGGEYKQKVRLIPLNGLTNQPASASAAIWFYEEKVSWLPVLDVPVEGIEINYPGNDWGEEVELPIYRDCIFFIGFDNEHQVPDVEPIVIYEGFPQPQGRVFITLEFFWRRMSILEFGIARARDNQKYYGP